MSKSDLGPELLQDQLTTADDDILTQRSSEVLSETNRDRDSVAPFAKDMIDNVVTGALSILDISRKEGKPWKEVLLANNSPAGHLSSQDVRSVDENNADIFSLENETYNSSSTDAQGPVVQVMHLRVRDDIVCDSVHAEQVAKIVKGLQDIQIGDSAYVLPASGSNIEKQVKKAVRNINSLEFGDMETAARLIICDGQGDVDAKILEAEMGPPSNANCKPQHDASKISTCFLHKMIEELEDNVSTKGNSPDHGNKEGIASWEESEEKFIRVIEGSSDEKGPALVEYQEYNHPLIFDQESVALAEENESANRNFEDSLTQSQQPFSKEEEFDVRENGKQSKYRLDNYTDKEPYWCTAGLITRVVTPEHGQVFSSKTVTTEKKSGTSDVGGNLLVRRTETSISVPGRFEKKTEVKDEESKLKDKKKKSFGRRLRKFFSKFKRNRDCQVARKNH